MSVDRKVICNVCGREYVNFGDCKRIQFDGVTKAILAIIDCGWDDEDDFHICQDCIDKMPQKAEPEPEPQVLNEDDRVEPATPTVGQVVDQVVDAVGDVVKKFGEG